jgi:dihydrofolate reductase
MISLIVAVAKNNAIGANNQLPWYLPEDLKRFKELTTGKVVIMGRKTFDSIVAKLGKPLPNRTSVVITRQANLKVPEGVIIQSSLEDALRSYGGSSEIFIIGGGEIYRQGIDLADRLYVTHINQAVEGADTFFPAINPAVWRNTSTEKFSDYSFALYERI